MESEYYHHPKVYIHYEFKDEPWGGGNQFLKGLKNYLINKNLYAEDHKEADIILFNSHHKLMDLMFGFYIVNRNKTYIHRIDGPIFYIRNKDFHKDKLVYEVNNFVADASIFQSIFSYNANLKQGYKKRIFGKDSIIYNTADRSIFNKKGKRKLGKKIKIVASSWSDNFNKGFEVYQYLDKVLDFDKYEMTFIGNSIIKFKNIKMIEPLNSKDLAKELKKHDIYITGSKKDPCSNSLIEAIQCGLIPIALNDGGHPELIKDPDNLFNIKHEAILVLDNITKDIKKKIKIDYDHFGEAYKNYYEYMKKQYMEKNNHGNK